MHITVLFNQLYVICNLTLICYSSGICDKCSIAPHDVGFVDNLVYCVQWSPFPVFICSLSPKPKTCSQTRTQLKIQRQILQDQFWVVLQVLIVMLMKHTLLSILNYYLEFFVTMQSLPEAFSYNTASEYRELHLIYDKKRKDILLSSSLMTMTRILPI